ncbi:NAD(P)H-dependent oxidoreductase [Gordonia sp. HY442]|uniref:CE1759 family FMN reductase n=1 Tax=Gordonia zhenghanii TaxID=2911516 RepID=UPI001F00FD40|nr:CE1759 family FMN reductase [Gordonia zhenghanii]MCF8606055.1 NAD(P)H-dependent oxidoreductase [Gordonia zhenghanii]
MTRRVVVVNAGVSAASSTRLLAEQLAGSVDAAVSARGEQVQIDYVDVASLARDLATAVTSGVLSTQVRAAHDLVADADGLIVATPVFAASYSGIFKMFFDTLDPDSITGVPVLAAATAGTPRHSLVIDHAIRPLLAYLRADVLPTGTFAATDDFGSAELRGRISRAGAELAHRLVSDGAVAGFGGPTESAPPRRSGHSTDLGPVTDFASLLQGHTGQA